MPQPDFAQTLSKDRHFLRSAFKNPNKYGGLAKVEENTKIARPLSATPVQTAQARIRQHAACSRKLDEIKKAIAENQVTIICGETGSGKTTQLPKICLELGRGAAGLIGHTQPRRLAARSVAERIAEELKSEIGSAVGYRCASPTTLARCLRQDDRRHPAGGNATDRYLAAYDTIIIDEAHERSLNIDFLGYLNSSCRAAPI